MEHLWSGQIEARAPHPAGPAILQTFERGDLNWIQLDPARRNVIRKSAARPFRFNGDCTLYARRAVSRLLLK